MWLGTLRCVHVWAAIEASTVIVLAAAPVVEAAAVANEAGAVAVLTEAIFRRQQVLLKHTHIYIYIYIYIYIHISAQADCTNVHYCSAQLHFWV